MSHAYLLFLFLCAAALHAQTPPDLTGWERTTWGMSLPLAVASTKFVKSFRFEMKPNDPWAMAGAAIVLVAATIAAGYGPAWRASRIDPWNALRHE